MAAPPFCSVVIPTRNRPQALALCLAALAGQEYPRDRFEVIVVDDAGAEPLEPVVAPFRERVELELIRLERRLGPAAARNAGAARAQGELLAFTDDDCRPERGWLAALAAGLARSPAPLVGGRVIAAPGDGAAVLASQLVLDLVYEHYNADPAQARFVVSNNMALAARDFHDVGGFDTRFITSEDRELCDRWLYAGRRIVYLPEAAVRHAPDLSLRRFWLQHVGYGRGAFHFHRLRAERSSGRFAEELSFYPSLARLLPRRLAEQRGRRMQTAGLIALWQVANAAGFVAEAARTAAGRGGRS